MKLDFSHFSMDMSATKMLDLAPQAQASLDHFIKLHKQGEFAFSKSSAPRDDIDAILTEWAHYFQQFDEVIVFGTGGSSLGGQALQDMRPAGSDEIKLSIITNIDPAHFDHAMREKDWTKTGIIAISKSGETPETLMQLLTVLPLMRRSMDQSAIKKHILLISMKGDNSMRQLAAREDFPILDHPSDLGGRYSVLSLVGLLPAMIVGIDPKSLRAGAQDMLERLLEHPKASSNPIAFPAGLLSNFAQSGKMSGQVMLCYSDRLGSLARWHRQLWAESLGKNGHGTTPIYGTGPVDQHSQLQLWLDGPNDKFYTILGAPLKKSSLRVESEALKSLDNIAYMKGRSLGELMEFSRQATVECLIERKRPTRTIILSSMQEEAIGSLLMYFMIETVLCAFMQGDDPFDQPAVERGKLLIKSLMAARD